MTRYDFDRLVRIVRAYSIVSVSEDEIRKVLFLHVLAESRR